MLQEWQLQQELARHTARWFPQDDSWLQSLFTWPAISWRGICRCKNVMFDLSLMHYGFGKLYEKRTRAVYRNRTRTVYTSWVTLPLHRLFLFLATVTKERAIPGTQLSWLWQTLVYGYALTRFQVNLTNCTCKKFEHISDRIFRIKPASIGN